MPHPQAKIHRMFEVVEPIATVTFSTVPDEAFRALGMRNYWDGYFAGRAAPLGMAPAGVVHAVFYNFADGEWRGTSRGSGGRPLLRRRPPYASGAAPRRCGR